MKTIGFALIVIGTIMIAYTGFNFITSEKVVDLGPIKISKEVDHPIQWSPILGGVILVGGIVIVVLGRKNND